MELGLEPRGYPRRTLGAVVPSVAAKLAGPASDLSRTLAFSETVCRLASSLFIVANGLKRIDHIEDLVRDTFATSVQTPRVIGDAERRK